MAGDPAGPLRQDDWTGCSGRQPDQHKQDRRHGPAVHSLHKYPLAHTARGSEFMTARRILIKCPLRSCGGILLALLFLGIAPPAVAQTRRVVLLYDERTTLPGLAALDASLVQSLSEGLPGSIEIYRESMDLSRFQSEPYPLLLRDFLRAKYAGKTIDVVIAALGPALDFMLEHGSEVFPGASVVF